MRHLPSFSLLSALEFRDVVTSLQHQTAVSVIEAFEAPITPFGGHRPLSSRSRISSPLLQGSRSTEVDLFDVTLGPQMHLDLLSGDLPTERHNSSSDSIRHMSATPVHSPPSRSPSIDETPHIPPTRWHQILPKLKHSSLVLFPHLHNFSNKSILSLLVAIFATPGVLAFTVTLPVVITSHGETDIPRPDDTTEGRLIDFEEDGIERVLVAEDELKEGLCENQFNKWLTALQCALGPGLCVLLLFGTWNLYSWGYSLI